MRGLGYEPKLGANTLPAYFFYFFLSQRRETNSLEREELGRFLIERHSMLESHLKFMDT